MRKRDIALFLLLAGLVGFPGPEGPAEHEGKARRGATSAPLAPEAVAEFPQAGPIAGWDAERVWSPYNDWEPAVAADPGSTWVYQMTTRYDGPKPCSQCTPPWIMVRRSSDGGATWLPDKFLSSAKKTHNDPQVEVALNGVVYAAWLHEYAPGVKFTRSTDHGATWSTPLAMTAGARQPAWSDRPSLAVSPDGRYVYLAYNASDAWVSVSQDFGVTFSRPKKLTADGRYWFHTGATVGPAGDVHFAAVDYSQDYTGDAHVNVQSSTNFGSTWTTRRLDTSREAPPCAWSAGCYLGFLGPSASVAADASGRLVYTYNVGATAGGPQRMWARASTDQGQTWSARVELSNGSTAVNNVFAVVAAAPGSGDFRAVWQDDRNGQGAWNTWYRRSTNGGATWGAAIRLSDQGAGAPYQTANGYAFPYGDYFELAVDPTGRNHVIWGEGVSYDGPGGTWYTRGQ